MEELNAAIALIERTGKQELSSDEAKGLLGIVTQYTRTWLLLKQFDDGLVEIPGHSQIPHYRLTYEDARASIATLKATLSGKSEASNLFGMERDHMLESIIGSLYQTFDRRELYPTLQEKAAHLLYFVIKDHPFTDGNKRIGVLLFLVFLERNSTGQRQILLRMTDSTLVALALLIAESNPKEKTMLIRLIQHFIAQ